MGYVRVISSERGRARQMNAGAQEARGAILLFLHADCRLPLGAIQGIEAALANGSAEPSGRAPRLSLRAEGSAKSSGRGLAEVPAWVGGCFTLFLDEDGLIYRLISWLTSLRMRLSGRMTADEGIFVRREIFERMGGFPEIALMEDWEFSRRLRAYGKVKQLPLKITISARRWKKWGIWRTFWLMRKLRLLYFLKVPPEELRKLYEDVR